jgi:site-specific recombinase XerD
MGAPGAWPPLLYSTLFGLIACTGLRISEALNLQLKDVTAEGLVVRHTKFGKSRLLPLHRTTRNALARYLARRCQQAGTCEYLFPSMRGRQLHGNTVRYVFRRLVRSLGIARGEGRPRPRLHDLLTTDEMRAILDAPDPRTRSGLRDQAMLYLGFAAGLRVSELVGLRLDDIELDGPYPSILVRGKGRQQRRLPLWKEATRALRAWMAVRGDARVPEVFLNGRGEALTSSGFTYIVKKYVHVAMSQNPGLSEKKGSPHVLRHTCAMNSLQATRDIRKVALWLGHSSLKSTEIYLRADPTEKLNIIEAALPPNLRRGVFQVDDRLIAWLSGKKISGVHPWPELVIERLAVRDSS